MTIQPRTSHFLRTASRSFSTTAPRLAEAAAGGSASKRVGSKRQPLGMNDIRHLKDFEFDDPTTLGYLRLEKIREVQSLVMRVERDRETLQAQRKPFSPPTGAIRLSRTIDLSDPDALVHNKRVLVAPVSKLPLDNADAVHRFKLLAGPRWTYGKPGRGEGENRAETGLDDVDADGAEGYVKMSEERFPEGGANRVAVLQTLERLVAAANDPNSPIPVSTPLDERHMLARQRKAPGSARSWRRADALRARPGSVGGVRGFPKEWMA